MIVSVFGAGMWAVAMVYQVIELGGSELQLSVVATATSVGLLLCALAGGVAADRWPRRTILRGVEGANLVAMGGVALLSFAGQLQLWHLAVAGFVLGAAAGFFFPAYSAVLPRILPADDLLAANGLEGMLRPLLQQAAGPAVAGMIVAALAPSAAIQGIFVSHLLAFATLWLLSPELDAVAAGEAGTEPTSAWQDLREGFLFTVRTPWLLWTLLWAVTIVFLFIGPFEVLTPFIVRDTLHLGADAFGWLLAIFGAATAVASMVMASRPMPRRYLTTMMLWWGFSLAPIAVFGYATQFWQLAVAGAVLGIGGAVGQVIWGTLLQRRVPARMLGRVSSLDFFVSLALMPVSMAVVGPLSHLVENSIIFLVIGIACPVLTVLAWWRAGMARDEIEHPLDGSRSSGPAASP